jgi:outer membrane protein assembly factor BamE
MKMQPRILIQCACWLLLSLSLSACFVRPYKYDLVQGNVITSESISLIRPGMSEDEVRYVLGSPMLHDIFHHNRWDYVYLEKPGYGEETRRHLAIYFVEGRVDRITQDLLPEVA